MPRGKTTPPSLQAAALTIKQLTDDEPLAAQSAGVSDRSIRKWSADLPSFEAISGWSTGELQSWISAKRAAVLVQLAYGVSLGLEVVIKGLEHAREMELTPHQTQSVMWTNAVMVDKLLALSQHQNGRYGSEPLEYSSVQTNQVLDALEPLEQQPKRRKSPELPK